MAEEEFEGKICHLNVILYRYGGLHTWYDAKGGLKRLIAFSGRIDDPEIDPLGGIDPGFSASTFHDKSVRLKIHSPTDLPWLEKIRTSLGVISNICGCIWVNANVEPHRFEIGGEAAEEEPVTVHLEVSADTFEAIQQQAARADDHHRIMQAKINLAGDALPETDSPIFLEDLDVSEAQRYAVTAFEIFDTRYFDHLRDRVLQTERGQDEGYGSYISVLLTEAHYEIHLERALVHSISCEGRVINSRGKPYDGADVTIEFAEFETNQFDELPRRAFFGEFYYCLNELDGEHPTTYLDFNLHYVPADARELLVPLFSQQLPTQVVLTINLATEEEELLAAEGKLRGNVRHYSFQVRQPLIDNA